MLNTFYPVFAKHQISRGDNYNKSYLLTSLFGCISITFSHTIQIYQFIGNWIKRIHAHCTSYMYVVTMKNPVIMTSWDSDLGRNRQNLKTLSVSVSYHSYLMFPQHRCLSERMLWSHHANQVFSVCPPN